MHEGKCQHLLDHLSDFVDGEASLAICAAIERHLISCEDCRAVVNTLRQTVELYRELPQPDLPEDLRERLYETLELKPFFGPKI